MWWDIQRQVLEKPVYEDVKISKASVIHPRYSSEFYRSIGTTVCNAHWRKLLPDGKCLHACEFDDHYLVHWDYFDPKDNPWGHILLDAKEYSWPIIGAVWDYLTE